MTVAYGNFPMARLYGFPPARERREMDSRLRGNDERMDSRLRGKDGRMKRAWVV